jgi:hypothetical protein
MSFGHQWEDIEKGSESTAVVAREEDLSASKPEHAPEIAGDGLHTMSQDIEKRPAYSAIINDPGPPPDGGWAAWIQVLMAHIIIFNTWGYINSFGVFQVYHVQHLHRPPSDIS